MRSIEESGRKRARRRNIRKVLLRSIKAAALAGIIITAPNVVGALKKLGIVDFKQNDLGTIARTRQRLLKVGLISSENGLLRLTARGEAELRRMEIRQNMEMRSRRWDNRWRVLIFDIPEYRKSTRNKMRRTLISVGFMRLQDSVWIYPYDCEDFVVLLKADFKIGRDVLYMIVDELEGDARIRKYFGLKP